MIPASSLSLLLLLLIMSTPCHGGCAFQNTGQKTQDVDPRARLWRTKELVVASKEMRQGDYRLVRPEPSPETQAEQQKYCTYKLNSFLMTLCTSTAHGRSVGKMAVCLHRRGVAAEAIALCLTNQPLFRDNVANATFLTTELNAIQQSELVGHSLAEGLFVLLQDGLNHYQNIGDGGSLLAMAQAAEAVWISSFHHPGHLQNCLDLNIIDLLGGIVVKFRPDSLDTQLLEHGYKEARTVMWACAALQNLAAYYCDNDLGHCIWEWSDGELVLDPDTQLEAPELADRARDQIAAIPNLIETLGEWVCQGPIHAKANATYGWPGDAILWKDLTFNGVSKHMQSPSIVPWAAAGVLKNLLLGKNNPELQERIHNLPRLTECLCALQRSPDYLEESSSNQAIFRWSPDWQSLCPDVYENCQDDANWGNAESGDTCEEYDKERWCVEYGDDVDANGKTAKEACCACGGGYSKENAEGVASPVGNATSKEISDSNMLESLGEAHVEMEAGEVPEDPAAADTSSREEL